MGGGDGTEKKRSNKWRSLKLKTNKKKRNQLGEDRDGTKETGEADLR